MTDHELSKYRAAIRGLLKIAEIAMPSSFFDTDSRVRAARKLLGIQPVRCEHCNAKFVRKRSDQRFCSQRCKLRWNRQK